jgi:hypothetical protein
VYILPFDDACSSRGFSAPAGPDHPGPHDAIARGWLRTGLDERALLTDTMGWLRTSWSFASCWWQANAQVPEQLAICDEIGLVRTISATGWDFRSSA